MADHTISLSQKQDAGAQAIVDAANAPSVPGGPVGTLTVDKWLKDVVLVPIRQRNDELDALKVQPIVAVLPDATNAQLTQIKTILGI